MSCAIIVGPQGGPKDILPPLILKETPVNKSVNFNEKKIILQFNEYIKLNDPGKEMIISPLINPAPEISVKKKSLTIQFDEKLKDQTTYTIQFGKSVSDITENNVLPDYAYVFSTGPKLDSLEISGKAKDLISNTYKENIKIMLHLNGNDSSIYKLKPEYYTKTQKEGSYVFENLHLNKYKIYALDDENGNYLFDKGEKIAFLADSVNLKVNINLKDLNLFKENEEKIKVTDFGSRQINKYFLSVNAPFDSMKFYHIISEDKNELVKNLKITENKDSAYFWITQVTDTMKMIVDIWGENYTTDTLLINIGKKSIRAKPPAKLSIKFKNQIYTTGKMFIEFNEPVINTDINQMMLYIDTIKMSKTPELIFTDSSFTLAELKYNFEAGKNYRIIFREDAFLGFDSITNDSISIPVRTLKESELGIISIDIGLEKFRSQVIVQLLNDKYKIIRENTISKSAKITYNNMLPGKYYIRCIIDKNKNNKWDTGKLLQQRQPEEIIYFNDEINLKANWELNDLKIKIQ
jgi:uncharacterized protein (DUF2141 family)